MPTFSSETMDPGLADPGPHPGLADPGPQLRLADPGPHLRLADPGPHPVDPRRYRQPRNKRNPLNKSQKDQEALPLQWLMKKGHLNGCLTWSMPKYSTMIMQESQF